MTVDKIASLVFLNDGHNQTVYRMTEHKGLIDRRIQCATTHMSLDELVELRDYFTKQIQDRLFTKHSQPCECY